MSFALIKLSGKSIVLLRARLTEIVEGDQLAHLKSSIEHIVAAESSPLYVIWDLKVQDIMVFAIQLLIYDAQDNPTGSIADPRLKVLIVGDHPLIALLLRKARDQLGTKLWQFYSIDDALIWARQESTHQN